jgi:hypothetical protein
MDQIDPCDVECWFTSTASAERGLFYYAELLMNLPKAVWDLYIAYPTSMATCLSI